jgi:hypothetical protein
MNQFLDSDFETINAACRPSLQTAEGSVVFSKVACAVVAAKIAKTIMQLINLYISQPLRL